MKRLFIIRHSKAAADAKVQDIERPLSQQGQSDARLMGEVLHRQGVIPDAIISSEAVRAQQSAQCLAKALKFPLDAIATRARLYNAPLSTVFDVIQGFDDAWDHVFLVGHNPVLSELANLFRGEFLYDLPSGALCVFEFDTDSWGALRQASNACIFYDYPKNHRAKAG